MRQAATDSWFEANRNHRDRKGKNRVDLLALPRFIRPFNGIVGLLYSAVNQSRLFVNSIPDAGDTAVAKRPRRHRSLGHCYGGQCCQTETSFRFEERDPVILIFPDFFFERNI